MLNKRTNILFEEKLWKRLVKLAEIKNTSVGKLVRTAVEEKYIEEERLKKHRQAFENILKLRPKPFPGKTNYKKLINEGRKIY